VSSILSFLLVLGVFAAKYREDPYEGAVVIATICVFNIICIIFKVNDP
jgi:hypothetical protein